MTDELPATIPDVIDRAAERFGAVEAMVDGDERWTFSELATRVQEAARAFVAIGVEPGDRLSIWAPNIAEWVVAELGLHTVGAVLVPLSTRLKGPEAADIMRRAGVSRLITVTDFLDIDYVALLDGLDGPELQETIVLRGDVPDGGIGWADLQARAADVDPGVVADRAAAIEAEDVSDILFTSGTTGAPKGAMLRHGAGIRAFTAWSDVIGLTEGDRYLIINPFFHSFGLKAGILACLLKGATMVPHAVFDVPSVMARIPEERISVLPGPPAIYQTMLNHPDLDPSATSTLRLAVTGAAPVPVSLVEDMKAILGFDVVVTGYGLTEVHGIATMCRHDDDPETISRTSGRAIPDVEVRVAADDGSEVPRGEPGEIIVRGYNLMTGYLDDPEQTAETIDDEGWLHTGDIGVMDEAGYIDITDRKKDMYIVGGFNAYPAEIESMLAEHPDVGQVAVVGVPDERLGEVGVAFVVRRPDSAPSADEIIAWSRDRMANYKVPRRVVLVDDLPLNASNKVLKYELRDRAMSSD
jgi:acyl-CoA synthetase (AMP-forming)/AMP-acid ligase II